MIHHKKQVKRVVYLVIIVSHKILRPITPDVNCLVLLKEVNNVSLGVKKGKDTCHPCRAEKQNTYMLFIVDCQKIKSKKKEILCLLLERR